MPVVPLRMDGTHFWSNTEGTVAGLGSVKIRQKDRMVTDFPL